MRKVYDYLDSHLDVRGVIEIDNIKYKISIVENLRHSERPEYRCWTNPYIGVWIIQPKEDVYLKVELI